jgi:hypothetical protein
MTTELELQIAASRLLAKLDAARVMLAALKAAYPHIAVHGPNGQEARIKVRAAIAQAEAAGIK